MSNEQPALRMDSPGYFQFVCMDMILHTVSTTSGQINVWGTGSENNLNAATLS